MLTLPCFAKKGGFEMEFKRPFPGKKFFVVVDEIRYSKFVAKKKVFTSYSEACDSKSSTTFEITDSFVRGFDTEEQARNFIGE